jgi:hypothetical protein
MCDDRFNGTGVEDEPPEIVFRSSLYKKRPDRIESFGTGGCGIPFRTGPKLPGLQISADISV